MYVKVVDGSKMTFSDVINDAVLDIRSSTRGTDKKAVILDIKYFVDAGHLYAFIEWDYADNPPLNY